MRILTLLQRVLTSLFTNDINVNCSDSTAATEATRNVHMQRGRHWVAVIVVEVVVVGAMAVNWRAYLVAPNIVHSISLRRELNLSLGACSSATAGLLPRCIRNTSFS